MGFNGRFLLQIFRGYIYSNDVLGSSHESFKGVRRCRTTRWASDGRSGERIAVPMDLVPASRPLASLQYTNGPFIPVTVSPVSFLFFLGSRMGNHSSIALQTNETSHKPQRISPEFCLVFCR